MTATIQKILKPIKYRAVDTSGNNNHGQIYSGRALEFDGVADYLSTTYGSGLNPYTTPITVACWIKLGDHTGSGDTWFGPTNGSDQRFYLGFNSSKFDMGIQDSPWTSSVDSGALPPINKHTWYRVVVVAKDGVATMYVNGESQFTKNYTSYTFDSNFYIGWHGTNTSLLWTGCLSDFQFWEAGWTQSDITFDYLNPESLALNNSGTSLTESNLKLWYPMQDGHRGQQSYILDGANTGLSSVSYYGGSTVAFASWIDGSGSGEWSVTNGIVTATNTGNLFYNNSATALVDGVTYKATIVVDSYTSGSVKAYAGGSQVDFGVSSAGTYSVYITNGTSNNFAGLNGAVFSGTISSVEFYPVNDKHHATTVFMGGEMIGTQANRQFASSGQWVGAGGGSVSVNYDDSANDANRNAVLRIDASSTSHDRAELPQVNLTETTKAGRTYRIEFLFRYVDNTNITANSFVTVGGTLATNLDYTATSWTTYTNDIVATDDSTNIRIYVNGGDDTGGHANNALLVDNVSIKEVGVASGWTDADQQLDIPQTALQSYNQLAWFAGAGSNQGATLDTTISTTTTDWSMSFWIFKQENFENFDFFMGSSTTANFAFDNNANRKLYYRDAGGSYHSLSDNEIPDNEWVHIVITVDGNTSMTAYVNGEVQDTDSGMTGTAFVLARFMNGYASNQYETRGCITEIAYFANRKIGQTNVNQLYNDGKAYDARNINDANYLTHYWRNNGLAEWKDLVGSNDINCNATETLLLPAGVDASRDTQGFLMNRQKTTNSINLADTGTSDNEFDNKSYVKLNNNPYDADSFTTYNKPISLSIWIKPLRFQDSGFHGAFWVADGDNRIFSIGVESGNDLDILYNTEQDSLPLLSRCTVTQFDDGRDNAGVVIPNEEWTHVSVCCVTGKHTASDDSTGDVMTDSGASFVVDDLINGWIHNFEGGNSPSGAVDSYGAITDNTATTITTTLNSGDDNSFDTNDRYHVVKVYVNGEAVKIDTNQDTGTPSTADSDPSYYVGVDDATNRQTGLEVDDVLVYNNKWLTQKEVTRIYNAGKRSHR